MPAPTSRPTRPAARCTSPRRRWSRSGPAAPRPGRSSRCPTRPSAAASPRRCAACSSHHMVIRDGKIANYHPYPPTPWNANPRDSYGTPGPYEDAVQGQPIFEENDREHFKGIDIMRTVRSFDPCLPCGVHMYLGERQDDRAAALPDPVRHRGVSRMARPDDEPGDDPTTTRSGAQRAIGSRPCWTPVRPAARWRASGPSSWSGGYRPLRRGAAADARPRRTSRRARRRRSSGSPPTNWSPA